MGVAKGSLRIPVASVLGWDLLGSADNGGLGIPLSTEEARALERRRTDSPTAVSDAQQLSDRPEALVTLKESDDNARPKTAEEAAETFGEQVEAVSQEAENATSTAAEQPEN